MNITVNSQLLAQELRLLNQVAPQKPSLPVLANILVEAGESLIFKATDLEIALRTTCQAQIVEPGVITLPAKRLLDLVEQLPNGDVQLATDKAHVYLRSGAFKGRLQTYPAEDFPEFPNVEGEQNLLSVAALRTLITRVRYAISDKGKYIVNGALLSLNEKVAALVATDGKRLSIATMSNDTAQPQMVVPVKTIDTLAAMFLEGVVQLSQGPRHIFFTDGNRLLISRTLEASFPAYERVIPKGNDKIAVVNRAAFAAALRRVGLMSEENQACILDFSAGTLILSAESAEAGEGQEQLVAQYSSDAMKICCNWQFMLDFLEAATSDFIQIALGTIDQPLMFSDGDDYVSVIMGMRP